MVEGRISAGVVVGDGSDIGGGASIMGTLSGGGTEVITLGEGCLLGANSGLGIPLGDGCVVEAGSTSPRGAGDAARRRRGQGRELAGETDLLFRRNSQSGGRSRRCPHRHVGRAQRRAPRQRLSPLGANPRVEPHLSPAQRD